MNMKKTTRPLRNEAFRLFCIAGLTHDAPSHTAIAGKLSIRPALVARWRRQERWDRLIDDLRRTFSERQEALLAAVDFSPIAVPIPWCWPSVRPLVERLLSTPIHKWRPHELTDLQEAIDTLGARLRLALSTPPALI